MHWKDNLRKVCLSSDFHEQFIITSKLGKGSFTNVYQAYRRSTKKRFAVKIFQKPNVPQKKNGTINSIYNEVKILKSLGSQGNSKILKFHEIYESKEKVFIVTELLSGCELYDELYFKKNLSEITIRKIMKGILHGIEAIHS